MRKPLIFMALLALAACKEEIAEAPAPVELTAETLSFFCQMHVAEHDGPKGQIHLEGYPQPIFFAQVRDLLAYLKSPERDARILASYVSDYGAAQSWAEMGTGNWIDAQTAHFVVGAPVRGGMGAPELVPFAEPSAALSFAARYGGNVVGFDAIPDTAVLGAVDLSLDLETPS